MCCIEFSGVNLVHSLGGRKKILPSPKFKNLEDGEKLTVSWN